ncbi:MAG: PIN domain nuclease, partial [Ilumatobacteraceae bacterium]
MIALARGDRRVRALLDAAQRRGAAVVVPASVLAETVRGNGPRDAAVNLIVNRLAPHPVVDDRLARAAGALMGRSGSGDAMDALVAAET